MGLDTSYDAWSGSYGAFNGWRYKIAEIAGYEMQMDDGFNQPLIDWTDITHANLQGIWDTTPKDPLIVLIAHSDCDGVIKPEQAKPLLDRLEKLLPDIKNAASDHTVEYYYFKKTKQFIAGLKQAIKNGEDIEFY